MIKFDLHCHTKAGSIDARISIERYIEILKSRGFSGMLVTDHDTYKGYRYYDRNCRASTENFTVLAGVEYDTKDAGHILVIMPDGIFLPVLKIRGMSLARLTHLVHQYGGILGPAHPFGTRYNSALLLRKIRKNPHLVAHFDFIEAFTAFQQQITCNNDLIAAITGGGIISFGGTERTMLPKHKKRHSLAASFGFRAYNRSLGVLYSPYRQLKLRKLPLHRKR